MANKRKSKHVLGAIPKSNSNAAGSDSMSVETINNSLKNNAQHDRQL